MKILILGGTEEARLLAERLVLMGHDVTTSLAGRTSDPLLPRGNVRIGGFGGGDGLGNYILTEKYDRVVDATHPYAAELKVNAVRGAALAEIKLVRLTRQPWAEPQYAFWKHMASAEEAAAALPKGARVLLTVGHTRLEAYLARTDCSFVVRSIEPSEKALPVNAISVIARPPFFLGGEILQVAYPTDSMADDDKLMTEAALIQFAGDGRDDLAVQSILTASEMKPLVSPAAATRARGIMAARLLPDASGELVDSRETTSVLRSVIQNAQDSFSTVIERAALGMPDAITRAASGVGNFQVPRADAPGA